MKKLKIERNEQHTYLILTAHPLDFINKQKCINPRFQSESDACGYSMLLSLSSRTRVMISLVYGFHYIILTYWFILTASHRVKLTSTYTFFRRIQKVAPEQTHKFLWVISQAQSHRCSLQSERCPKLLQSIYHFMSKYSSVPGVPKRLPEEVFLRWFLTSHHHVNTLSYWYFRCAQIKHYSQ